MSPKRGVGGLVAGIDCSTQSTKVVIVDVMKGRIVARGKAEHVVLGSHGARETDPMVWWSALKEAFEETGIQRDVAALAVAGQQHGLVTLDSNKRPLRNAVLWNDTRSASDALALVEALGGPEVWANQVGSVPVPSFTVTSWAWLRRTEPDVASSTAAVRLPHDFLTERLTGRAVTDRGDASGTGWWSTATEHYVHDILDLPTVRIDREMLPEVVGSQAVGEVTTAAAAELGLRAGVLVASGTGDNMAAALGLGLAPGEPVLSLGTSGTAYLVSTTRSADSSGTVAGFADATGRFLPLACTLNCTMVVDRVARWFGLDRDAAAADTDVTMLPFFDGERTPNLPNASGTITGLHHETAPEEILLAAYEGAVAGLLTALDALDRNSSGIDEESPIILIGGGAKGATWRRVVSNLSGRPIVVPDEQELVALGAAVQAASILTGEDLVSIARQWGTRVGAQLDPSDAGAASLHRITRLLHETLNLNAPPG